MVDQRGDEAAVDRFQRLAPRGARERDELRRGERLFGAQRPGPAALQRREPEAVGGRASVRDAEERQPARPDELEVRLDRREAALAEEVLAEAERHRDVEAALEPGRQREDICLDRLQADAERREELRRLIEREARAVDQRHLRAAARVEDCVEPAAGAELDCLEPVEVAEAPPNEPFLGAPSRRPLLGPHRGRVERLSAPLRVPVRGPLHGRDCSRPHILRLWPARLLRARGVLLAACAAL